MTRRSHNRSPCCGGLSATMVIEQFGLAIGRPDFACRGKSMAGAHLSASDSAEELFSPTAATPARMNRCIRSAIFRPRMICIASKASASCIDCSDLDSRVNGCTFCRGQGKIPRDLVLRGIVDQSNVHQMKRGTEAARAISLVSSWPTICAATYRAATINARICSSSGRTSRSESCISKGGNQVVGGSQ
jgi:hypothetical protein